MRALLLLLAAGSTAHATTYYVTPAGGLSPACDGTTAVAAPAAHCAWASPMVALPPAPYGGTSTPLIHGGDTLLVADGSYMIGIGAPGTGICNAGNSSGCTMAPVPSGPDATHPTRVIGNVAHPVELWGVEKLYMLLNLTGSSNVEVAGFELTDHSPCIQNQSRQGACKNTTPYGPWAQNGFIASDSSNVWLHDMYIHGLGNEGAKAGRLTNWTVERVRIIGNGFAGWDGDISNGVPNAASNHGAMVFRSNEIAWNGCGELYPATTPYGCWAQNIGGYGDGFATGHTSGNWLFEDNYIHQNVQDCLDLLYGDNTATLIARRNRFVGCAGNQLKWRGISATITDNLIVGDCFSAWSTSYTTFLYNMDLGDVCRASGSAIALSYLPGSRFTLDSNTITGGSGSLVELSQTGTDGSGPGAFTATNNIFDGNNNAQWQLAASGGGIETVGGVYDYNVAPPATESYSHNVFWGVKNNQCPAGSLCVDPQFVNANVSTFNPQLVAGSPAVGYGSPTFTGTPTPPPPPPTPFITCTAWTFLLPIQGAGVPAIQCTTYH